MSPLQGHKSCQQTCSSVGYSPWVHRSCQEPAPARALHGVTASFGCIHLLQHGILHGLQSLGTSPDYHEFSNMMESGLATTSSSSLRTLGRISLGPMDFCMFRFLMCSRTGSFPTFAFLRFRVLSILFTWPISLKMMNSMRTWLLQPRLPPILTSLISSSVLVSNRSSNASPLIGIKNLSSTHSKSLLNRLQLLCRFSSRCQVDRNPPAGSGPASTILPVVEAKYTKSSQSFPLRLEKSRQDVLHLYSLSRQGTQLRQR
ncbi:hypothetical protein QYF61_018430 [Mycteria americana]|uniref:Uncharacterized protein n=1 Tax=Mycteria americana TaxID=33587 RepID=A0AAN7MJU9_MYCAM|nr:hypothetical protein QYF61_018430 [Mycteria americana]